MAKLHTKLPPSANNATKSHTPLKVANFGQDPNTAVRLGSKTYTDTPVTTSETTCLTKLLRVGSVWRRLALPESLLPGVPGVGADVTADRAFGADCRRWARARRGGDSVRPIQTPQPLAAWQSRDSWVQILSPPRKTTCVTSLIRSRL